MAKIRELYRKKADALEAAQSFHKLWGGWYGKTHADDKTKFSFEDDAMSNMSWSGELNAVQVYGGRHGMAGLFAWWEE